MKPIKIIIADDHWMVRDGIKQLLELDQEFSVVAQAGSAEECVKAIQLVEGQVLLLDINMPGTSGIDIIPEIKKINPNIKILMLTIHNEVEYLNKAFSLGANGYALKDSNSDILKKAIKAVINQEKFVDPTVLPYLYSDRAKIYVDSRSSALTDRENEVLVLLTHGLFNKEIGYKLGISEKTVKNHVSNIFRKLEVSDRTQAAIYAVKNNIVSLD
ncbi:MAG: response regulator transcription factor [bacterium]|nr:response regulator transcription factor [bacterium]